MPVFLIPIVVGGYYYLKYQQLGEEIASERQPITPLIRRRSRRYSSHERRSPEEDFSIEVSLIPTSGSEEDMRDPRELGTPRSSRPSFQILLKQESAGNLTVAESDSDIEQERETETPKNKIAGRKWARIPELKKTLTPKGRSNPQPLRGWGRSQKQSSSPPSTDLVSTTTSPKMSKFVPVLYCHR